MPFQFANRSSQNLDPAKYPDTSGNTLTSAGYSSLVSAVGYSYARAIITTTTSTTENAMIDVAFRLG